LFAALQKDAGYKDELESCERSRKQYKEQDKIDIVLGVLKDAQKEAENLWDGCNHMFDEADKAHDAAINAFDEGMKLFGDDYDPRL